jgi:hypothetical protein
MGQHGLHEAAMARTSLVAVFNGGLMMVTSLGTLNNGPCFSGMCAASIGSWVCLRGSHFHNGGEGVCDNFFLVFRDILAIFLD